MAHQITMDTAKTLEKTYPLYAIGLGGSMMDNIKKMHLSLRSKNVLSIDEARIQIVNAIQLYLNNVNKNEKVRPYLANYPFTPKNIEIILFIFREDEEELAVGRLAVVSNYREKVRYEVVKSKYHNEVVFEESFEEAKRIVEAEGVLIF